MARKGIDVALIATPDHLHWVAAPAALSKVLRVGVEDGRNERLISDSFCRFAMQRGHKTEEACL